VMVLEPMNAGGIEILIPSTLLIGIAVFDTLLVVVSRRHRGAPICRGARDHLTHRLLPRLHSARNVAVVLASVQTILCCLAVAVIEFGSPMHAIVATSSVASALVAVSILEFGEPSRRQLEWIYARAIPVPVAPAKERDVHGDS